MQRCLAFQSYIGQGYGISTNKINGNTNCGIVKLRKLHGIEISHKPEALVHDEIPHFRLVRLVIPLQWFLS